MKSNIIWREELVRNANFRMDESLRMIDISLQHLEEDEIWQKPNGISNSIGNLILHLCGNITQYILSSLGDKPDMRNRDEEFAASGGINKNDLLNSLVKVVGMAKEIISATSPDELVRIREVQGFQLSGIGIIIHVVEHLSYHTGQIAYWTKLLKNSDLGFYDDFNLNIKNK